MPFNLDQVNQDYGFFGTIRGSSWGLGVREALTAYNRAIEILGGDPEIARQFLDSPYGRYYADALTFIVPGNHPTLEQLLAGIDQSPKHKQTAWITKKIAAFKPYESLFNLSVDVVVKLLD